jgi:hypothetical protein
VTRRPTVDPAGYSHATLVQSLTMPNDKQDRTLAELLAESKRLYAEAQRLVKDVAELASAIEEAKAILSDSISKAKKSAAKSLE